MLSWIIFYLLVVRLRIWDQGAITRGYGKTKIVPAKVGKRSKNKMIMQGSKFPRGLGDTRCQMARSDDNAYEFLGERGEGLGTGNADYTLRHEAHSLLQCE